MEYSLALQILILLPVLLVPAIVLTKNSPNMREAVSLAGGVVLLCLAIFCYQSLASEQPTQVTWLEILPGLSLSFLIEPYGVLFALVASFLWIVTTLYAIGYMRGHNESNQTRFYACFAIAITGVMGVAMAENLFTLFLFYELLTLSTYPLVTHAGNDKAKTGGRIYLSILLGTSILLLLPAIIITWSLTGTLSFQQGGILSQLDSPVLTSVLLVLFVFGIGKAALMPVHRWLPAAMVAPTPVSALLHAVAVVKAGVFSLLKVCGFIFGGDLLASLDVTQWLLYLAGVTIIISSLIAMRQDNLKARLAYSTVSQLSYITLGALLATSLSLTGGAMHIAMHAFGKITLFFCAGAIYVACHKTQVSELRGLGKQMPVTMVAFFIGSLSIIGLPPAGGTWSKWYLVMSTIDASQWFLLVALMLSSLLNIVYLLSIPVQAFMPVKNNPVQGIKEAPLFSLGAIVVTSLGCIWLFVQPQWLLDLIQQ
ncbi:proton-conducting transporter membrane subunit [Neptunicella marina]|uniref:Monovalent cation/H+ antiporter subunit D family protein n=1 Tax=Neptunicella marina TaxID=2125989 RepID=A0A8J6M3N5_9ALTE|nr:proton-conducting transporter membrane subunit [Neptunicella marina]MBC3765516.1 monovalent cation/H+ antiporter subunit D family protein [Neptunicella marina]